jgi:hypothetical protein
VHCFSRFTINEHAKITHWCGVQLQLVGHWLHAINAHLSQGAAEAALPLQAAHMLAEAIDNLCQ